MISLLVMTDGRGDCIERTIPAALDQLQGPITRRVIHDDSADPDYRAWLAETFPAFEVVGQEERQGFGGAIRSAWALLASDRNGYVFHLEDDFVLDRPVHLSAVMSLLAAETSLAQVALRRQPVNDDERAAGGVVEQWPHEYRDHHCDDAAWLEHSLFFTTNPSLYRSSLLRIGWPGGPRSEVTMTDRLKGLGYRFAFWGERADGPWVTHIGDERAEAGCGY